MKLKVGDYVQKISGYKFPGIVRSIFTKSDGITLADVECIVPGVTGMVHIYRPEQLQWRPSPEIYTHSFTQVLALYPSGTSETQADFMAGSLARHKVKITCTEIDGQRYWEIEEEE